MLMPINQQKYVPATLLLIFFSSEAQSASVVKRSLISNSLTALENPHQRITLMTRIKNHHHHFGYLLSLKSLIRSIRVIS